MKKLLSLVLALAMVLSIASIAVAEEKVTLSFMLPQTHYQDFMKKSTEAFMAANPGIIIDVQAIPDNQWIDLVKTKVNVDEAPDIIRVDKGFMLDIGIEHFLEIGDAEPWYSRANATQLAPKLVDGKVYGMPICSDSAVGLIYNKSLFEKFNVPVPTTMDELYAACETFKANGIDGMYASDKDTWTTQIWLTAAAAQCVAPEVFAKIMKNEMKWTEVPELEAALTAMAKTRLGGYTNSDFLAATYDGSVAAIAEGKAAMFVCGQFAISAIKAITPDIDLGMCALPYEGGKLGIIQGVGQLSIFNTSKHVKEAKLFLDWMSQPEQMTEYAKAWGEYPVYSDQKMDMPAWMQEVNDIYLVPGKTAVEMNSLVPGIDLADFWSYQQEMLTGSIDAKVCLEKWQKSFEDQAKAKGLAGF
ncbi:MAG: ABC transporter substrate-binding protein [Clostridia bacterium]